MSVIALFLTMAAVQSAPEPVKATSKITMRLIRGEKVTAEQWQESRRKSERVIIDENGRKLIVRIIEHE